MLKDIEYYFLDLQATDGTNSSQADEASCTATARQKSLLTLIWDLGSG
jgi:hypothetical protein